MKDRTPKPDVKLATVTAQRDDYQHKWYLAVDARREMAAERDAAVAIAMEATGMHRAAVMDLIGERLAKR